MKVFEIVCTELELDSILNDPTNISPSLLAAVNTGNWDQVPLDSAGFTIGAFKITVEWVPDKPVR
jgi:hypothetical protein